LNRYQLDAKDIKYPSYVLKLFFAKCGEAKSTDKALHTPWCHIIFGF
jgi:hypothetical protein